MKKIPVSIEQDNIWDRLRTAVQENGASEYRLLQSKKAFFSDLINPDERIAILTRELLTGDRHIALTVLGYLDTDMLKLMLPPLVRLTLSYNSSTEYVLELLHTLPRPWLIGELEHTVKEAYANNEYSEPGDKYTSYVLILRSLVSQDRENALLLAKKAAASSDEEIREAGLEFLQQSEE